MTPSAGLGDDSPIQDGLLRRVLADPATGLPSLRYFRLIREWEERQAARTGRHVRTIRLDVTGGDERLRRSLPWRLCGEFRSTDLLASEGLGHFRLLLTGPDAEQLEAVLERIRHFGESLASLSGGAGESPEGSLKIVATVEPEHVSPVRNACDAPDPSRLETPTSVPRFEDEGRPHEPDDPRAPGMPGEPGEPNEPER